MQQLTRLKLIQFRNYSRLELYDLPGSALFHGPNGSGKTNLLEAIHTLCALKPLRPVGFPELVRHGDAGFYLGGDFNEDTLEFGFSADKKMLRVNGSDDTARSRAGRYPLLAMMPEDTAIVTGSPEERRSFLDRVLCSADPAYTRELSRYQRALRERNAQFRHNPADITIWEPELVLHGCALIEKRLEFIQKAGAAVRENYESLYGHRLEIRYLNTFRIEKNIADSFREALRQNAGRERLRGHTLVGPHRDYIEVYISHSIKSAKSFASQGQRRAVALFMKLAGADYMSRMSGQKPVVLLDDVLLEMDAERRAAFLDRILPSYQVFMTATSPVLLEGVKTKPVLYRVRDNTVIRE